MPLFTKAFVYFVLDLKEEITNRIKVSVLGVNISAQFLEIQKMDLFISHGLNKIHQIVNFCFEIH